MALVASDTAEFVTSSGTAVDLVSFSGLSIPVTDFIEIHFSSRCDSTIGAANGPAIGLKINGTITQVPGVAGATAMCRFATSESQDQTMLCIAKINPRSTNYLESGTAESMAIGVTSGDLEISSRYASITTASDFPNATITDIVLTANNAVGGNSIWVKNVFIYTYGT